MHGCAVFDGGSVRCWGLGFNGALGYGDEEDRTSIPSIPVEVGAPVTQVAVGNGFSCAVLEGERVRCWGYGSFGQLGYGFLDHDHNGEVDNVGDGRGPSIVEAGDVAIW
jgi:alpha-tubulin suppressor-like RCC1 family protein